MAPKISEKREKNDILNFRLTDVNVSIVNGLRRTMISDIESVVFHTFPYSENNCTILKNTSRFNNEIIKQRLSCVPIHITDFSIPLENYLLIVNKKNDGVTVEYITTEDFQIKDVKTDKFLSKGERDVIFPKNSITDSYIEFLRLRPKLGSNLEGEELSLTCKFSVSTAKENSCYNQTSTCMFKNTLDAVKANDVWSSKEKELKQQGMKANDIAFEKKNWFLLDANRIFIPDSFDFTVKSVGIYSNTELVKKACNVIITSFEIIKQAIETDNTGVVSIKPSISTIENSFDVILHGYDYTVGKVIEYFLYNDYFQGSKLLSFCGFNKEHPHDTDSILRIGFKNQTEVATLKQILNDALVKAIDNYNEINDNF